MRPLALSAIDRYLKRLARRRLLLVLVRDLGLAISTLGLILLAALLGGLLWPESWVALRRVILSCGVIALVFWLAALARASRRHGHESTMRLIGLRHPTLADNLRSALELAAEARSDHPRFSVSLFAALVADCARRVRRIPPSALLPARRLTPIAVALSLTALSWSVVATVMPDSLARAVKALRLARPVIADERSEPLLGDLRIRLVYPPHTGRKPRDVQNSTGQITAPPGTQVTFEGEPLQPVRSMVLVFEDSQHAARRFAMKLSNKRAKGTFTVTSPGRYTFSAELIDGEHVRDPARRRIDVEPDAAPAVTLYGPQDDLEVSPKQVVELGFTADDDFGLTQVRLAYRLLPSGAQHQQLWRSDDKQPPPRRHVNKLEWNLEGIDLSRGGRLEYWIEAVDNDTVSGPKTGQSKPLHLRIFSPDDRHDRTLAAQKQLLAHTLELLAGRLVLFDGERAAAPATRVMRALELHRFQKRTLDAARDLENKMHADALASAATLRTVARIRARLDKQTGVEALVLRTIDERAVQAHQLRAVARENDRQVVALEDIALQLASLLDEQKLQRLRDAGQRMIATRKQLQKLLAAYRKTRSKELKQRIQGEIARLRRQLHALMAQLASLDGSIADEHLNADAIASLDLSQRLAELDSLLRRGDIAGMEKALAELDAQLASMGGMLEGNLDDYRGERFAARERAFGAAMDALHDLRGAQKRLARRTSGVIARYHHRAAELLRQQIGPQLRAQRKRLGKLAQQLAGVEERRLAAYQRDQLRRVKDRVNLLERALHHQDLAEALEMAQLLHGGLRTLRDDVQEDALDRYLWRRPTRRALQRIKRATAQAAEIETDLEALLPSPQRMLTPAERKTLRQGRRDQQQLQQRLEKLGRQLGEGPAKEVFGPAAKRALQRAGSMMEEAARQLGSLRPKLAHAAQREAGRSLDELRKQAHRARSPRTSAESRRHRVRIPDANDFKAPEAFRGDLLDAMKEPPPPGYDSPVRRYYEELVR